MDPRELIRDTHDRLSAFIKAGDYGHARDVLKGRFGQLPPDVQSRVLMALLADALELESKGLDSALLIQQEGVTALKALEALRLSIKE